MFNVNTTKRRLLDFNTRYIHKNGQHECVRLLLWLLLLILAEPVVTSQEQKSCPTKTYAVLKNRAEAYVWGTRSFLNEVVGRNISGRDGNGTVC